MLYKGYTLAKGSKALELYEQAQKNPELKSVFEKHFKQVLQNAKDLHEKAVGS